AIADRGGDWCLAAIHDTVSSDSLPARRYAFFYVPPTPANLALPADADTAGLARRSCRLGAIWVEAPSADTALTGRVADSLRAGLTRVYGAVALHKTMAMPSHFASRDDSLLFTMNRDFASEFGGSGGWTLRGRWESDSLTVVSAREFDREDSTATGRVFAFAYEPVARLDLAASSESDLADTSGSPAWRDSVANVFVRFGGVSADSAQRLAELTYGRGGDTARLVAAAAWVATTPAQPPATQAALLVAADLLPLQYLARGDSALAKRFASSGIEYAYSELGATWSYTHTLLKRAANLAPESPAGRWARLQMMGMGFNLSGMCGGGNEPFVRVSEAGLALLAGDRDSTTRGEIELLIAEGYADIVALASGGAPGDYARPAAYAARAPEARRNAIPHFRAAFALDPASRAARTDWPTAWRLVAGLPVFDTHFFCIYD
ncbi:MAG: hypothetical protein ACRENQ_05330, partial [Gemmatimonadaceae bacterium]